VVAAAIAPIATSTLVVGGNGRSCQCEYWRVSDTALASRSDLLAQARLAQVITVAWMLVEGLVAIALGIAARSVALTAFGTDSAIELFTAIVVLRSLRGVAAGDDRKLGEGERQASRLVGRALYVLAGYIVVSSAWSLLGGLRPEPSAAGILLAVASLAIMPVLWRWRLRLAERLPSAALHADAACSAVCIYMAATLLVGLLLNRIAGWWWVDLVAALAMIWWIRGEAKEALEAAATGERCQD
jgi:divalent metal cation (Fe/Co/Zn/Cd) transporter